MKTMAVSTSSNSALRLSAMHTCSKYGVRSPTRPTLRSTWDRVCQASLPLDRKESTAERFNCTCTSKFDDVDNVQWTRCFFSSEIRARHAQSLDWLPPVFWSSGFSENFQPVFLWFSLAPQGVCYVCFHSVFVFWPHCYTDFTAILTLLRAASGASAAAALPGLSFLPRCCSYAKHRTQT